MRLLKLFSFTLVVVFVSFISMGVVHAAITIEGPFTDTTTQGDWTKTYAKGGSCFYLLPTPPPEKFTEFLLNTTTASNICEGGSLAASEKLVWDMFSLDNETIKPIWLYYFDPSDPLSETRPVNGTHPADQWNPCKNQFFGATFDNGDLVNGIFEPLVSEVEVNHTGSFRIAYYFLEANVGCRKQNFKLFINDIEYSSGMWSIEDFDSGKYVYFNIQGLTGTSVIRLEVTNPGEPVCDDQANYGNVHLSGIFIDKCNALQGCTPGYWKQCQHFDSWVGYKPDNKFCEIFDCSGYFSSRFTLLQALQAKGGCQNALARAAAAALLNDAAKLNYKYDDIIGMVNGALATKSCAEIEKVKNQLDYANNAGCPLESEKPSWDFFKKKWGTKLGWFAQWWKSLKHHGWD